MGCYRYQDVKTVPFEGLICLLWDVPKSQRFGVVDYLSKTSLIEVKGEYHLHPTVSKKARLKLKINNENWKKTNICAAKFFRESVISVETVQNAIIAFEAFYFYIEIRQYNLAADILLEARDNTWERQSDHGTGELLGYSFLRLGLLETIISSIGIVIKKVNNPFQLVDLHNLHGDLLWLSGMIKQGIQSHEKTFIIVKSFDSSIYDSSLSDPKINLLRKRILSSLMNRGLCYLSLGDYGQAHCLFLELQSQSNQLKNLISKFNFEPYLLNASFCLALTYSFKANEQMVMHCISQFKQLECDTYYDSWSRWVQFTFYSKIL